MQIGLDFDGVIADSQHLKTQIAQELFGIHIPAEKFKAVHVIKKNILTLAQYQQVHKTLHTRKLALDLKPVAGMLEYLPQLLAQGHHITIISAREGAAVDCAQQFLAHHHLVLPFVSCGVGKPKTEACKKLDFFVDDDYHHLLPLAGIVPRLFLFSWPYNEHEKLIKPILRVHTWSQLYEQINANT